MPNAGLGGESVDPVDLLMAYYAFGLLEPPMHALAATHLALSPVNRGYVAALESLSASRIVNVEAEPIVDREARLAAIFASEDETPAEASRDAASQSADAVLPSPLRRYLGSDFASLRWRTVLPGVREWRGEPVGGGQVSLLWASAGRRLPRHTHTGMEVTLLLKGSFTDARGRYARGDIAIAEPDLDHEIRVDEDQDCICFVVNDGVLRLTGPIGRIIDRLFGSKA